MATIVGSQEERSPASVKSNVNGSATAELQIQRPNLFRQSSNGWEATGKLTIVELLSFPALQAGSVMAIWTTRYTSAKQTQFCVWSARRPEKRPQAATNFAVNFSLAGIFLIPCFEDLTVFFANIHHVYDSSDSNDANTVPLHKN